MSSIVEIGMCQDHKYNNEVVCKHCGGCRCCDPHHDCSFKRNHIGYNIICIYQHAAHLLTNKGHSNVSESEKKRRRLNIKTKFHVKYTISLTEIFNLCHNGKRLLNKQTLNKIHNCSVVKVNACGNIPKGGGIWMIWRQKEEDFQ